MTHFDALIYIDVEKIMRKGEIACKKQFLLFSHCYLPYMALILHFEKMFENTNFVFNCNNFCAFI